MTILPPKKKRDREVSSQRPCSSSGSDHRQSSQSNSSSRIRNRKNELNDGGPLKKRCMLSPSSGQPSPLSSPRCSRGSDDSNVAGSSSKQDYNSDDEYASENSKSFEHEKAFSELLKTRGLCIKEMVGDGACMFRAIAEQVYGDQEMHAQIRKLCMDYMASNKDHFEEFITEDYEHYIARKRDDSVHGNHVELQAISEMFSRPLEIYQYSDKPINILLPRDYDAEDPANQQNPPLRLSYHGAVHYNAIINPHAATIGVGLGLPGLNPGGADRALMTKAMEVSELHQIEETMLKDKMDSTDWQRTQADIEEQITRDSYYSYMKDLENKKKEESKRKDERNREQAKGNSPSYDQPSTSQQTSRGLYEELLLAQSLEDNQGWSTEDMDFAQALALSQQDFSGQGSSSSSKFR